MTKTLETPNLDSKDETMSYIENTSRQIGDAAKNLLQQLREGKITPNEVNTKMKEWVDAAIVTVTESSS